MNIAQIVAAKVFCFFLSHWWSKRSLLTLSGKPVAVEICVRCGKARVNKRWS